MMYIGYREVFGILKIKNIWLLLFLCMSLHLMPVFANEKKVEMISYQKEEVTEKKMTFLEDLHYRIIYKDTKDFFDYVLLGSAIISLLIVMVFQNTHYVIVVKQVEEATILEEEPSYSIEEKKKKKEDSTIENPEILSSALLEEEKPVKTNKKKNKKKRV